MNRILIFILIKNVLKRFIFYKLEETLLNILENQKCTNLLQKYVGSIVFSTSLIAASSADFYVIKAQNIVFHPNANTLCKQETQDCQNPLLIPMFYVAGFWTSLSVQVWANTLSNEALCQNFFYFDKMFDWRKLRLFYYLIGKDPSSYDRLVFSPFPS